jgi:hypothetical protein
MIDIEKAFMLGLVSGEQVELKDLVSRNFVNNNATFSINSPTNVTDSPNRDKRTKAYLSRQQHMIKTDYESIKINGSWLLELVD